MYLCLCNCVTEETLLQGLQEGQNHSPLDVCEKLRVGTDCGSCRSYALKLAMSAQERGPKQD